MSEVPPRNKLWSRSSATLIVCIADRLATSFPNTSSQGKKPLRHVQVCVPSEIPSPQSPCLEEPQGQSEAWTIDGGKSSCIVSSKVNSEGDAQKLGIIGYDHGGQYVLSPDQ
ncbi:hypothetical protein FocTR4_00013096 [Fusarium oxysporum f. sp. cubense]|uniref:Uncharacterized protein n=1 Tax=Fusarium oxysporum f. sp. cubense TaxID=61366 RepID=A0A5C6SIN7_FUSOC|nr:hypothetical protein FocTR4_00013096 [Fusarium oxysporum f. sp. cubense]